MRRSEEGLRQRADWGGSVGERLGGLGEGVVEEKALGVEVGGLTCTSKGCCGRRRRGGRTFFVAYDSTSLAFCQWPVRAPRCARCTAASAGVVTGAKTPTTLML